MQNTGSQPTLQIYKKTHTKKNNSLCTWVKTIIIALFLQNIRKRKNTEGNVLSKKSQNECANFAKNENIIDC